MADNKDSGFKLPPPKDSTPAVPGSPPAPTTTVTPSKTDNTVIQIGSAESDTSARDMAIGGGVLLVLLIAFFFAKNAYANRLVAKRVAPSSANGAGWWLFIFLSALAIMGVLGVANADKFLAFIYVAPLTLIAFVALVFMLLTGRR
jgi:hypothetical protein